MLTTIIKRDGREVPFDAEKITGAIMRAFLATEGVDSRKAAEAVTGQVVRELEADPDLQTPTVENIQDAVERVLIESGYVQTAKSYILYRAERSRIREMNTRLMRIYADITNKAAVDSDIKRENANINGDTAMGAMLKYGSEGAKQFNLMFMIKPEHAEAHRSGDIHIHDMDFLTLTTTCTQIDLIALFRGGFSTGHGYLREPKDIRSYAALACIAIQANQNDQHGGQSIVNFDYGLAPGVAKTYKKLYLVNLKKAAEILAPSRELSLRDFKTMAAEIEAVSGLKPQLGGNAEYEKLELAKLTALLGYEDSARQAQAFAIKNTEGETDHSTYQAMEALIHNLNTMHSRAGAQTPFSSINYGMDTTPEGRMVIKNVLLATEAGLGHGETPIFPIHIFRVKEGINYNPGEPNYDLFQLACRVSAKRLFPNFSFVDAPFNLQYYREGHPETEIAYMGCRTRVIGNVYDKTRQITNGRGNLSFTSINLPRLAIESHGDEKLFFEKLDAMMNLVAKQLSGRFEIQAKKRVRNFPFLMGQGVWIDSEKLRFDDEVREVLKHGTLSIGFIGLAETLVALYGHHHGENAEMQQKGLDIIRHMREFTDAMSEKTGMNYTLLATPAEGLSGRFIRLDKKKYGLIPGVTDKEYYTNSFHVPVYYRISAFDKIAKEAPYHALTNAGHISYVELDGDTCENLEAFETIVRAMHDAGIGYGSINHPVDRDPVCGYNGIIGEVCPQCHRHEGDNGVGFERIRRITGYLVGTLDRFNNAKRAEEHDRVKHGIRRD